MQRRRCFWLHGPHNTLPLLYKKGSLKMPEGFSMKVQKDTRNNITYKVSREVVKPWPSSILFEGGFAPLFQPGAGQNTFHTFTREFCHPPDRLPQASAQAADRFN